MSTRPPDKNPGSPVQRKARWRLVSRLSWVGTVGCGLAAVAFFWVLPWLGRRGDLNPIVNRILSEALSVPVRIGIIETRPLNELKVTRLESVRFDAQQRLHFATDEISLAYEPLEILSGHVRRVEFAAPDVFINLNADLSDIATPPTDTDVEKREDRLLPFVVDVFSVRDGKVILELEGERAVFHDLQLEVRRLGQLRGQDFELSVAAFGGKLSARGKLDVERQHGAPIRYTVRETQVRVEDWQVAGLWDWLLPNAASRVTQAPRDDGRISLDGSLAGTWPESVELRLNSRAAGIRVRPEQLLDLRNGDLDVEFQATARGGFRNVALRLKVEGRGTVDDGAGGDEEESGGLALEAEFRQEDDTSVVQLGSLDMRLADGSHVVVSGSVDSPFDQPRFDFYARTSDFNLAENIRRAGHVVQVPEWLRQIDGKVDLRFETKGTIDAEAGRPRSVQIAGTWRQPELGVTGIVEAGAVQIAGRFRAGLDWAPSSTRFQVETELSVDELLIGNFYDQPVGEPLRLHSEGTFVPSQGDAPSTVKIHFLDIETPMTGPTRTVGSIRSTAQGWQTVFRLEANTVPAARAFDFFLVGPLRESAEFLDDSALQGAAKFVFSGSGPWDHPSIYGLFQLRSGDLRLGKFRAEELEVDLPFLLGPPQPAAGASGGIRARRVTHGNLSTTGLDLKFAFNDGVYRLARPLEQPLLGSTVSIHEARVATRNGANLRLSVMAQGLQLEQLTAAYGLPAVPGDFDLDLQSLTVHKGDLEAKGKVGFNVFAGRLELSDLRMRSLSKPYASLFLRSGSLNEIHLGAVGEVFNLGVLSGVMNGTVENLGFTGGELTSFRIDAETAPRPNVPQYVDRRAIQSLRSIVEGHLGALEKTVFSRFRYADFGFRATLENGGFTLHGNYPDNGVEYIMRPRWYQIPQISIINWHPGKPYPWETIASRLLDVYQGEAE